MKTQNKLTNMKFDVIIVGAGAAGLTAAIYTCRKGLKTAVISIDVGGQTVLSSHIENYPAFVGPGYELITKFKEQALSFGAKIINGKVVGIVKGEPFKVELSDKTTYEADTLILAYGKIPKTLGIPGEDTYMGKGVHTCATCDAPLYKGKTVAVVGGGNSALDSALMLSGIAKKVYLIHRRDSFRGDQILAEKLKQKKNMELVLNHIPVEIKGDKFVKSLTVESTGKQKELAVDGIFLEIGYEVRADFLNNLVKLNGKGEIITDKNCDTSCKGVFAAGDVTDIQYKQVVIAAGEGAKAALSAYAFLKGHEYPAIDWGHK
ncbi:MAG: FAD-dependent oxidoreductase [Candidatus Woesearchaeota archaeon]